MIDISSLLQSGERPSDERQSVVNDVIEAIGEAARGYGAFMMKGHGISQGMIDAMYDTAQRFFALPLDEKMRYYIGENAKHRGYVPLEERGDYPDELERCYEAFDLGLDLPKIDPDSLSANRLLGPNVWPSVARFKEIVSHYYQRIAEVAFTICSALERALKIPASSFTRSMKRPVAQLRLLHYTQGSSPLAGRIGMGAHTDYECLTLSHQRSPGLQIMNTQGDWVDVLTEDDCLFVHLGDMLEVWTNGWLTSTPHQVINTTEERYSLVYFAATDYDTLVEPLAPFITPSSPQRYQAIHAGHHIEQMLMRDFPYLRALQNPTMIDATIKQGSLKRVTNPFERRIRQGKG